MRSMFDLNQFGIFEMFLFRRTYHEDELVELTRYVYERNSMFNHSFTYNIQSDVNIILICP